MVLVETESAFLDRLQRQAQTLSPYPALDLKLTGQDDKLSPLAPQVSASISAAIPQFAQAGIDITQIRDQRQRDIQTLRQRNQQLATGLSAYPGVYGLQATVNEANRVTAPARALEQATGFLSAGVTRPDIAGAGLVQRALLSPEPTPEERGALLAEALRITNKYFDPNDDRAQSAPRQWQALHKGTDRDRDILYRANELQGRRPDRFRRQSYLEAFTEGVPGDPTGLTSPLGLATTAATAGLGGVAAGGLRGLATGLAGKGALGKAASLVPRTAAAALEPLTSGGFARNFAAENFVGGVAPYAGGNVAESLGAPRIVGELGGGLAAAGGLGLRGRLRGGAVPGVTEGVSPTPPRLQEPREALPPLALADTGVPRIGGGALPEGDAEILERLAQGIKSLDLKTIRQTLERAQKAARGERIGAARPALQDPDPASLRRALEEQLGPLTDPELRQFEALGRLFAPDEVKRLHEMVILRHQEDTFKNQRGRLALHKLLGTGELPDKSEITALREALGADVVGGLLSVRRSMGEKAWLAAMDVIGLPRAILASGDLSLPFRQGLPLASRKEFWGMWGPMLRALVDDDYARALNREMLQIPTDISPAAQSGYRNLDFIEFGAGAGIARRAEEAQTRLADVLPVVKQSNRAFSIASNKLRRDYYMAVARKLDDLGTATADDFRTLARWSNAVTGRADVPEWWRDSSIMAFLNNTMFSPRYFLSRLEILGAPLKPSLSPIGLLDPRAIPGVPGTPISSASRQIRKEVARDLATYYGIVTGSVALAGAAGATITLDPRSSDFGKIKVGNIRVDPGAGGTQLLTFMYRMLSGERITLADGTVVPGGPAETRWSTLKNFIRGKTSPPVGIAWDVATGEFFTGEDITLAELAKRNLVPIAWQDIIEAVEEEGLVPGMVIAPLTLFGVGVNTFSSEPPKAEQIALSGALGEDARRNTERLGYASPSALEALRTSDNPEFQQAYQEYQENRSPEGQAIDEQKNKLRAELDALGDPTDVNDPTTGLEWREARGAKLDFYRGFLAAITRGFEDDPDDPRARYGQIIEDNTDATGRVDWGRVEADLADLPQADQDFLDQETGIGLTPVDQKYRATADWFDETNGFTIDEDTWATLVRDAGKVGFTVDGTPLSYWQDRDTFEEWVYRQGKDELIRRGNVSQAAVKGEAIRWATNHNNDIKKVLEQYADVRRQFVVRWMNANARDPRFEDVLLFDLLSERVEDRPVVEAIARERQAVPQ